MTDREIFKDNLNYYLEVNGKKQKDLADFVGAKTTTVSGWTRGISYPRADAMEKIALFFGIPTSSLVGPRNKDPVLEEKGKPEIPKTIEAQTLARGVDKLPQEQREQALNVIRAMFAKYADYFYMEDDDDT